MPEQPDNYEPTEADLELIAEDVSGKPVKPANLAAGIALMQQRIKELEAGKAKLLDQMDTANEQNMSGLNEALSSYNRDLAMARERLNHYRSQAGKTN